MILITIRLIWFVWRSFFPIGRIELERFCSFDWNNELGNVSTHFPQLLEKHSVKNCKLFSAAHFAFPQTELSLASVTCEHDAVRHLQYSIYVEKISIAVSHHTVPILERCQWQLCPQIRIPRILLKLKVNFGFKTFFKHDGINGRVSSFCGFQLEKRRKCSNIEKKMNILTKTFSMESYQIRCWKSDLCHSIKSIKKDGNRLEEHLLSLNLENIKMSFSHLSMFFFTLCSSIHFQSRMYDFNFILQNPNWPIIINHTWQCWCILIIISHSKSYKKNI